MNTLFTTALATAAIVALPALASAQACPDYSVSGAPLSYDAQSAYVPQSTPVVAGGTLNLSACTSLPGVGYIVANPDFTMQYQDLGMGRMLEIRVNATCDAVLLVNGADGQWHFNDDTNGSDPAIQLTGARSGQYDIWVGTFDQMPCDATLTVETF